MENKFERAPSEESPKPSKKSPENNIEPRIDEKIIDAIANGKWANIDTEDLIMSWREMRNMDLYRQNKKGIDDVELYVQLKKSEIDLFKKAYNQTQTSEGKESLKVIINAKVDELYDIAKDSNYENLESIMDLEMK